MAFFPPKFRMDAPLFLKSAKHIGEFKMHTETNAHTEEMPSFSVL